MNRRKMLEVSRRQKVLGKRSSVAALHSNPNVIVHPKIGSPALEKGIQHGDAESCQIYSEVPETQRKHSVPKTKFTSNDKSSEFSPRLKSFPAEELRRFDASPRLETTLAPFDLTGDDGIAARGNKIIPQRLLQPQTFQNPPNPEVFNVVPLERSPERQPHRPHVPRSVHYAERVIAEHQSEGNFLKKKEPGELERQPVGGRNAAIFKQQVSGPEQTVQAAVIPEDRLIEKEEHQHHRNHVQFADNPQENPEQMYLQNYPEHYVQHPQHYLGLGMTSPQDVSINHSRMCQQQTHPHHHQSFSSRQQGRGPWPVGPHLGQQFANAAPAAHQITQQSDQGKIPSIQRSPNVINYSPATQPHHQRHQRTVQPPQESPKLLQFTPEMIQDQEKLVQILRQQGFPDEIIKRQFDGLLAEQQRQLLLFHQLENPETTSGSTKIEEQPRRRRITRVEEDEKPEWMMHITPPWVSHATLEQMERNEEQKRQQIQQDLHEHQEHSQQQNFHQRNLPEHVQLVNPVVHQQFQQQQMMTPNAHYPADYHQQHHAQQVPSHPQYCQHHQNIPEGLHPLHQQQQQTFLPQNKELIAQDRKSRVEPSSLLKERRYREVVKRQRQNNGLQEATAIKEATEALRNPMNTRGLEYLANLDKKHPQIKLNGTQDPEESILQNWPHRPPEYALQQSKREARANGLENERNPDNPRPPVPIFHGNESMPMYPRRVKDDQLFYSVHPPLGDNGIYQNCASALRNIGDPSQGYENNFQAHVNNQVQGGTSGSHQEVSLGRSSSLPFDMYSQQRQEYPQDIPMSCLKGGRVDANGHGQIKGQCYPREYFEEPRVIGGVKYIARKTEFIPNSRSPGQF